MLAYRLLNYFKIFQNSGEYRIKVGTARINIFVIVPMNKQTLFFFYIFVFFQWLINKNSTYKYSYIFLE